MKLPVVKKTVLEVDYNDIDELITKEYGREYECIASEKWCNGQSHSFNIEKTVLDEYEQNNLREWKSNNRKCRLNLRGALIDLCNRGVIEPGEYLIEVYW